MIKPPSIYRAFHIPTGKFLTEGALTLNDTFLVPKDISGNLEPIEGVRIEFFIGRFTNDGTPVYQNDIVKLGVANEFGSQAIKEGTIRYDHKGMCYFIDTRAMSTDAPPIIADISLLEVTGHAV